MWYRPEFTRRVAITLDVSGGATPVDANITIPKGLDDFWSVIDTDGDEIAVVDSNSETLLEYTIDDGAGGAFSKTNRLGRLRLNAVATPGTESMVCLWLYYNTTSAQGDRTTGGVYTSPVSGYIELARPTGPRRFTHRPQLPGGTRPQQEHHKAAAEVVDVWVHYSGSLSRSIGDSRESSLFEELYYATQEVHNTSGSNQGSEFALTATRFVWDHNTGMWVKWQVKAGTDGESRTLVGTVRTLAPGDAAVRQTLQTRIGHQINDTHIT